MLEKMTLEEFQKIKKELANYLETIENTMDFNDDNPNFNRDEYEKIAIKDYQHILKKLLTKDLSDIPFSEWEGIYIISSPISFPDKLDFSKTRANLDFSIIQVDGIADFHNCHVKNLKNLYSISEESFDEEVIKSNPDVFLSSDYPIEFRKKYYARNLTLADFNLISNEQIDKLNRNKLINLDSLSFEENEIIFKRIGLKRALTIYNYSVNVFFDVLQLLIYNNAQTIIDPSFLSELENIIKVTKPEEIKKACFEWLKKYIMSDEKIRIPFQITDAFKEQYPEYFPDFTLISNPNLSYYYLSKYLNLNDLLKYSNNLKGKQYAYFINNTALKKLVLKVGQDDFLDIIKENNIILELLNDNNFVNFLANHYVFDGDLKRSFKNTVKTLLYSLSDEECQKWSDKFNFHYVSYPTIEDLKDPDCLIAKYSRDKYLKLGIANIIKFEEETQVFSLNSIDFYSIQSNSLKEILSYEEFVNSFLDSINYENLKGSFKEKNPELFLPDDTPEDIKEKFYNHLLTPQDFINDPKLITYFKNTDLSVGLKMAWLRNYNQNLNIENRNKINIEIAKIYSSLNDRSSKEIFKDYISRNPEILNDLDKLEKYVKIIIKIKKSNSLEMQNFSEEILTFILATENPEETYLKIEDIFTKNNLPMIAKIFNIFELLHPNCDLSTFDHPVYSPTLNAETAEHRSIIIFTDLLKAALGSNNRSLQEYIENIEIGNDLFMQLQSNTLSYDNLTEEQRDILETFVAHLNALYNSSQLSKDKPYKLTYDLKTDLETLNTLFKPTKRYDLPDRIVRMFAAKAGIKSFDQLKKYLTDIIKETDQRNREASQRKFKLEEGDFIKGIADDTRKSREAITFLNNIFQNGSLSKEFLGADADSDLTPLDTDCSIIQDPSADIEGTLSSLAASYYGKFWFVLKNRDSRFTITKGNLSEKRPIAKPGEFTKLEAFYTGPNGLNHYGIRTGFASSDIDFIVSRENDKRLGLEIAKNGFYIPVVDLHTEKLIFTPEDYDRLRSKMAGLKHYQTGDYVFSYELEKEAEILDKDSAEKIAKMNILNIKDVEVKRKAISLILAKSLAKFGLTIVTTHKKDLSEGIVELIDTGSTGRGTNVYGDGDFDFMMKFDQSIMENPELFSKIQEALKEALPHQNVSKPDIIKGNFRFENVIIPGLDSPVQIDISFATRTDKISYSTDEAIKERLANIKKLSVDKYNLVLKNIIAAKALLKEYHVYKKEVEGGLGGVGVENWILQNGGSLETAAKEFLKVAETCQDFSEFCDKYQIWDFGENHYSVKEDNMYLHDNFVKKNMTKEGYEKMCKALRMYLNSLEITDIISKDNLFKEIEDNLEDSIPIL